LAWNDYRYIRPAKAALRYILPIFNHVSQKAWADWQKHQTLLINEKRLNMMNAEDRKFLQTQMDKFLSGEEYAQAEGYVPPEK